jgi:uncharacterized membrane protein
LSLVVVTPFKIVFGDYRYGLLAALVAAVLWIGYARPGPLSPLVAVLLLTQPRGFYVLEQGWTEPIIVALLAATTVGMLRGTAWSTGWRAGLLLVTKQYMVFPAVLFLRFLTRRTGGGRARPVRTIAIAMAVGAGVTIPFLLADPGGFVQFVFKQQASEPFRVDSLSYVSLAARYGWGQGSLLVAVATACVALVVSWRWIPNTAAGFAAGTALTLFVAFAFGSKAFCNYYYLVVGAICCAIATADAAEPTET